MLYVSKIVDINGNDVDSCYMTSIHELHIKNSETDEVKCYCVNDLDFGIYFHIEKDYGCYPLGVCVVDKNSDNKSGRSIVLKEYDLTLMNLIDFVSDKVVPLSNNIRKQNFMYCTDKSYYFYSNLSKFMTLSQLLLNNKNYHYNKDTGIIILHLHRQNFEFNIVKLRVNDKEKFDALMTKIVMLKG